jgi:hypothetical protein
LLETNLLPNTFTTEAYITFEDEFNNFFFNTNRGNYPYSCFLIKIAPDPMRNNFLDLGVTCSDRMYHSTMPQQSGVHSGETTAHSRIPALLCVATLFLKRF